MNPAIYIPRTHNWLRRRFLPLEHIHSTSHASSTPPRPGLHARDPLPSVLYHGQPVDVGWVAGGTARTSAVVRVRQTVDVRRTFSSPPFEPVPCSLSRSGAQVFNLTRLELRQLHHVAQVQILDVVDPRKVCFILLREGEKDKTLWKWR